MLASDDKVDTVEQHITIPWITRSSIYLCLALFSSYTYAILYIYLLSVFPLLECECFGKIEEELCLFYSSMYP